jgi:hypothetical protein
MNLLGRLRDRRAAAAARDTYLEIQRLIDKTTTALAVADDPRHRAPLLFKLAHFTLQQADVYNRAWGAETDPDGTDAEQSLRWTACLYRLLADVEQAIAFPGHGRRVLMSAVLGQVSDEVLERMATTVLLGDRMALLRELRAAVRHVVGEQAASSILLLPYPNGRITG